jgi:pimeloyl-ACP methyl ester carboxylesterase
MPKIKVDDFESNYQVDDFSDPWRHTETILLHHAAAGNIKRWYAWVPALAQHYRVIRMDARGHGDSTKPPPDYRWDIKVLARDISRLIEILGLTPVHLVGASGGGIVCLQFAHDYPQCVRSLSLVASTPKLARTGTDLASWRGLIDEKGVKGWLLSNTAARFAPGTPRELTEWFAQEGARTPLHIAKEFTAYMATVDLTDTLGEIKVPTLILAARSDTITPMEVQHLMVERIPKAKLKVFDGVGHNMKVEIPDALAAEVLTFVQQVDGGG